MKQTIYENISANASAKGAQKKLPSCDSRSNEYTASNTRVKNRYLPGIYSAYFGIINH